MKGDVSLIADANAIQHTFGHLAIGLVGQRILPLSNRRVGGLRDSLAPTRDAFKYIVATLPQDFVDVFFVHLALLVPSEDIGDA